MPDRLSGEAIGIGTRLLMVAVDYEGAMAGALVRARLTPAEARQLLRSSAGQRLDPQVVALFIESLLAPAAPVRPRRTVAADELLPGMQLAEDLMSQGGLLLLPRGQLVDEALIQHFHTYQRRNGLRLRLTVFDPEPGP